MIELNYVITKIMRIEFSRLFECVFVICNGRCKFEFVAWYVNGMLGNGQLIFGLNPGWGPLGTSIHPRK